MLTVESIRRQFVAIVELANDAGVAPSKLADIQRIADALAPFSLMALPDFEQFLRIAFEYKTTGVLSPVGKAAKTTKQASKAGKRSSGDVDLQLAKLRELYEVVHEETVGRGAIKEMCEELEKFTKDQVHEIARSFGMSFAKSTGKSELIKKIEKRLDDKKHAVEINELIVRD